MRRTTTRLLVALLASVLSLTSVGAISSGSASAAQPPLPDESRFQKVLLDGTSFAGEQPVRISVTPDGRVLIIERTGAVKVWSPTTQATVTAGTVPTQVVGETGLIGLTLAPDFATTGHIYLNYALSGFNDEASPNYRTQRVSRFTLSDDNVLDLSSEVMILETINRRTGGHSGGDLEMTPDGVLFITTGDNTNCCAALGWAPLDERPGEDTGDAQRTSANTNDLNGKLLRIRPLPEGGYTIPEGNLFPEAQDPGDKTRPEIYLMGFRNLFTIGDYDEETGNVWIADYGPDAVNDSERGPKGYVRPILATEAANYGWPYCTANNIPYADWDFENNVPRGYFDCDAPVNDSPNNTGLVDLPPIKPATLYYPYTPQEPFPTLFGGGAHAGPRYEYDPDNPSPTKFPEWFDGRYFLMDFTTLWARTLRIDDGETPTDIQPFLPEERFGTPMDMRFGPDGSLYVLEFGTTNFASTRTDPALYRIDYVEGNRLPRVVATSDRDSGPLPLTINFDASESTDPDGDALTYSWDLDGDGAADATGSTASFTYTQAGAYAPRVTVTDANGASAIANMSVVAGNTRPTVTIETPIDGTLQEFGEPIPFKVTVTDPEDGDIDCTDVEVLYSLGHNTHAHQLGVPVHPDANCEGVVVPESDAAHGANAYLFHLIEASYTDDGGVAGTAALEGTVNVVLHPSQYRANTNQGESGTIAGFGNTQIAVNGGWVMFPRIDVRDVDRFVAEVSTQATGAELTLRADSPTGPVVARLSDIPNTGQIFWGRAIFQSLSSPITDPGGARDLYLVASWPETISPVVTLRFFQFVDDPVTFAEVGDLLDELEADDRLASHVAATLRDRLARAEALAATGSETRTIGYIDQAIARAANQIRGDAQDIEVRELVVSTLQELVDSYQALEEEENSDL